MGSAQISVNESGQATPRADLSYDPIIKGLDASFWKTIAATVSVSSNKIRLASGGNIASYTQFKYGKFQFAVNVPTTPSAGEAKKWGLLLPAKATKGSMYFEITGTTFRAVSYDEDGTAETTTVTWSSYEAVETLYEIEWGPESGGTAGYVIFKINGTAVATHKTRVGHIALPLYLINSDADNTDIGYLSIKEVASYVD